MISSRAPLGLETTPVRPRTPAEREPQRAARRQEVLERAGQDRQRLDRVNRHTYLLFQNRTTADEVMQEIAATPIVADGLEWPVQIWDEAAGAAIGTTEAADGRVAVGHAWSEKERAWLAGYVAGWRSVTVLDALPADWKPKEAAQPARTLRGLLLQAGLRAARSSGLDRIAALAKSVIAVGEKGRAGS